MLTPIQEESFRDHNPMEPNKFLQEQFEVLRNFITENFSTSDMILTLREIYGPVYDSVCIMALALIFGTMNAD